MEHTIKVKWPKLFGKKKVDETEVVTEVDLENKDKYILIGGALIVGIAIGYMVGHNRGSSKMLERVIILK